MSLITLNLDLHLMWQRKDGHNKSRADSHEQTNERFGEKIVPSLHSLLTHKICISMTDHCPIKFVLTIGLVSCLRPHLYGIPQVESRVVFSTMIDEQPP